MKNKIKKRVLSGMRASGRLHLGNYLGGAKGMLALQDDLDYETFYMVADVHGITAPFKPEELTTNKRQMFLDYLAVGLDPEKSVVFMQSDVPEHAEMAFYLSSVVTMYRMQHLPTFKEEVKKHPDNVTMALLNYPVLMASDILIYKAGLVPVGVDQEPHLEVTREIARKMNDLYSTNFPEPIRFTVKGNEYVPSLLGDGKMSKSVHGSYISLTDDLETIQKKVSKIPTDSGKGSTKVDAADPVSDSDIAIFNETHTPVQKSTNALFTLVQLFEGLDRRKEYERQYEISGVKYSEVKAELAEAIYEELKPIQERRRIYENDPSLVERILKAGAEKARKVASETVDEVKMKMGLK